MQCKKYTSIFCEFYQGIFVTVTMTAEVEYLYFYHFIKLGL